MNEEFKNCKELISLMLEKGKINYPQQIKIAKKLLSLYPDMTFWRGYDPKTYLNSLAVFLTVQGNAEIKKNYDMWLLTKPKEKVVLSNNPLIDIKFVPSKPTTLAELLDN